jgi:hypothetical protein
MKLPKQLKSVFWDVNLNEIDEKKHQNFLITRIAEKGRWPNIVWLKNHFSLNNIKQAVVNSRNTSKKTKNFWQIL